MNNEEEKNIYPRIIFFRSLVICLNVICLVQLILAVALPDILSPLVKTWLIVVVGGGFIGLGIALFLAKSDPTTTLFLILLSTFLNGLFCGISIIVIVLK